MSIVSQKVDARNEIGGTGFVRAANKGIVRDGTGRVLCPIGGIPEAFTTDVNDVQGQFPVVFNTDRMPFAATHNLQYYYDNASAGGTIVSTPTAISLGKGVVSEEGGYVLLDIKIEELFGIIGGTSTFAQLYNNLNLSYSDGIHWYRDTQYPIGNIPQPPVPAPQGKKWVAKMHFRTFVDPGQNYPQYLEHTGGIFVNGTSISAGALEMFSQRIPAIQGIWNNISTHGVYVANINQNSPTPVSIRYVLNDMGLATLNTTFNNVLYPIDYNLFLVNI